METDKQIQQGLGVMGEAAHRVEPLVKKIMEQAARQIDNTIQNLRQWQ
ncbi:MAG: hypothetical protein N2A40_02830 [Desulfobulbaceae bacterium]